MSKLIEKAKSVGIQAESYKRGPLGKHNFSMTIIGNTIKFWEGDADIEVRTNKKKRQCLVIVNEKARAIPETVSINNFYKSLPVYQTIKELQADVKPWRWRSECRISVPNAKIKLKSFSQKDYKAYNYSTGHSDIIHKNAEIVCKVEHVTKATKTTFLIGYDESSSNRPFICQLKDNVNSFQEAYESLKPVGVTLKKGYKRQGEWFFNPVSKKLNEELMCSIHNSWNGTVDGKQLWSQSTSHTATVLRKHGRIYAIGKVKEKRKGRHEDLKLVKWHEVARNNEVEQVETVRNWD